MSSLKIKVVTVAAAKGGVGKSTLCANIPHCWTQLGLRCLVIDLDPQGSVSRFLGNANREKALNRLAQIKTKEQIRAAIETLRDFTLPKEQSVISLLEGSPVKPAEFFGVGLIGYHLESYFRLDEIRDAKVSNQFMKALRTTIDNYKPDVVVFDTPPSHMNIAYRALREATHLVVPLEMSEEGLRGAIQVDEQRVSAIEQAHLEGNATYDIKVAGVVPMRVSPRKPLPNIDASVIEIAKTYFEDLLTEALDTAVTVAEANSNGMPVIAFEEKAKGIPKEFSRNGKRYTKSGLQMMNIAIDLGCRIGLLNEVQQTTAIQEAKA